MPVSNLIMIMLMKINRFHEIITATQMKRSRADYFHVCLYVCLQSLTFPVILDLFKVRCSYFVCMIHELSTFR